jgi:hypothetical protein
MFITFDMKLRSRCLNTIRKDRRKIYVLGQLKDVSRAWDLQVWTEGRELDLRPSILVRRG